MSSNIIESALSIPISYNQKKILKAANVHLNNFYSQLTIDFDKDLSSEELLLAIKAVIKKHEVLCLRLNKEGNEEHSLQISVNADTIVLDESDWKENAENPVNHKYDASIDAPIRFHALKKSGKIKSLLVRYYAIWGDTYSSLLFCEELGKAIENLEEYESNQQERIVYSAYCEWNSSLVSESDEEAVNFWNSYHSQISNKIVPFSEPSQNGFKPERKNIAAITNDNYKTAKALCEKKGISLSDMLLLNFVTYLRLFTENEITIGYYPLKRNYSDLDYTLGAINKLIPLNSRQFLGESVEEKVNYLKSELERVNLWSDYFLLNTEQNDKQSEQVFHACFEFIDIQEVFSGKDFKISNAYSVQDQFEIKLSCIDYGDRLSVELYYDTAKFSPETIHIISSQLNAFFGETTVINENKSIPSYEEIAFVNKLNETNQTFLNSESLIKLFENQALQSPENIALIEGEYRINYKELDTKATQFAHYLIDTHGVTKGDAICILTEPSENFIVAVLGILKAGAFYVPIDHNYPEGRIQFILKDSKTKLLITDKEYNSSDFQDVVVCNLSSEEIYTGDASPITPASSPDDIVYCIYTSGSTGNPKGCFITQKNILNYISWANEYYFEDENVGNWALITSVSFDLTVTSIFTSLTRGKKIWIGSAKKDIAALLKESFNNPEIDTLKITPSHVSLLKELDIKATAIKIVICGGEHLTKNQIKILKDINIDIKIYNEYGPTEATVGCVAKEVTAEETSVLIGKPIANTQILIVDNEDNYCSIGVLGEMIILGDSISIGYNNRPELNAEKFIDNYLNTGKRAYKTGDLGRWLPNGNLEYSGRKDNQVKIRGYRIELDEIERKILTHEHVQQIAVLVVDKDENDKQILAFVVSEEPLDALDLRNYLSDQLPEYMVPNHFFQLKEIPLTNNGKVDKKQLIQLNLEETNYGSEFLAPRNEVELNLAAIWSEILKKDEIGVYDDFFILGGQSLKAIRLINEYHKKFGVKLSLKELFNNTTLESHVKLIENAAKSAYQPIEKAVGQEHLASDGQRRIWMLSQFEESSIAYNMPEYLTLYGVYNAAFLEKAIQNCIKRHEILRTVYHLNENGFLYQQVLPVDQIQLHLEYHDFASNAEQQLSVAKYIDEDTGKPFDLTNGPLLRGALFCLAEDKYVFYYNLHHIVGDAWSMKILEKEVFEAYEAYQKGEEPKLPELKIQYKDYSEWKTKQLTTDSLINQKNFWLDSLSGELPKIDLTNTSSRPKRKTYNGQTLSMYFAKDLSADLKKFCDEKGGSLFMGLLSIWNVLLSKYTSGDDIIIGSPVSCRDHKDLENQIGFYLNTLVLRNKIQSDDSFEVFFDKVKATTLEVFKNQAYPYDLLVEDLNLKQDISRNAVFDVMFTLQDLKANNFQIIETDEIVNNGYSYTKFDLDISVFDLGDTLSVSINYNIDVYDQFLIENLIRNFNYLAANLLKSPELDIKEVPYISSNEQHILLSEFNNTSWDYNKEASLLDLLRNQVFSQSDAKAIVFDGKSITYKELDKLSDQLSEYLTVNYNNSEGDIIAIELERTEWLIIAMIAVLKMGCAYVPVSPSFPEGRKIYIKEDSGCTICIDQNVIEEFNNAGPEQFQGKKRPKTTPESLLYTIYTSGTTGNPKGVMVSNKNLVSFIENFNERFNFFRYQRLGLTTNFTFDISILEILGGLCTGKELHLFSENRLIDLDSFIQYLTEEKLEILQLTPSRLSQLFAANITFPASMKVLLVGGEAMHQSMYETLKKEHFDTFNVYGPTETTIWSTSLEIKKSTHLSIGKPLLNESIYILNSNNKLLPVGVVGELCIGGDGIAIGYKNQALLTQEKFITNPYNDGKLYKTGDMARWLADGTIEFIGRKDNQVKIRGHRIELGEIENAILSYEDVKEAVVLVKENETTEKEIVVFMISDKELKSNDIKSFLVTVLPNYMIPSLYVQLEKFPLSSSGKVERKLLLSMQENQISSGVDYLAPRDSQEQKLIEILSQNLDKDQDKISIHDNFFDLGANSLKIIKLLHIINQEMNVDLKVVTLFEYPNVYELAQYLKTSKEEDSSLVENSNISNEIDEILDLL